MDGPFQKTLKRRSTRDRFYSSMNYDEYYMIYGPPAPVTKPQQDPTDDVPFLELEIEEEQKEEQSKQFEKKDLTRESFKRLDTILQIQGSENASNVLFQSPRVDNKLDRFSRLLRQEEPPKRMRIRNRSQSDNSEYLIFNFLERAGQTGKKKIKFE